MSEDENGSLDLLLIGKTGNGKSATGNSILQKPKTFKVLPTTQSVTTHIQSESCRFNGRLITIVDGPGLGDTRMSEEEALKLVQDRLKNALRTRLNGYNAFLMVVRYGGRFTKEDIQTVACLKRILGKKFVKQYCVLVMTCGDLFERDMEENEVTFDQWLQDQEGVFRDLLFECNKRVVMFDNKTKEESKKDEQIRRLISIVDGLGGKRYSYEHFERERRSQQRQMVEAKEPRLREETKEKLKFIHKVCKDSKDEKLETQIKFLEETKVYAEIVLERLQNEDKGTDVLKSLMDRVTSEISQMRTQMRNCQARLEEERAKQRRAEMEAKMDAKLQKVAEIQEEKLQEQRLRHEKQRYLERKECLRRQEEAKRELRLVGEMERISLVDERRRQERAEAAIRGKEERRALEEIRRRPEETRYSSSKYHSRRGR